METNIKNEDPLEDLFSETEYSRGFKNGKIIGIKTGTAEKNLKSRIEIKELQAEIRFWKRAFNKLELAIPEHFSRYALKCGLYILKKKYKTMDDALKARDLIYKPNQRDLIEVIKQ